MVASFIDSGVQILDITDPYDITAAGGITDTGALKLAGAYDITTFESGGSTYAAVTAFTEDGVQILRLTDPVFVQVQDSTPPTFVSSEFDGTALTITFSETIAAANVDPAKIHVRESGNYTGGGITLTAGELDTTADADTISFALTESSLAAVKGLDTPELTIEPGAVRDTAGNPIVGTFDVSTAIHIGAFDVSGSETSLRGMAFSSDGAKMFVVGSFGGAVHEYDLSAPFDVSTASANVTFSVPGQENFPRGMAFSSDGAKMFVAGGGSTDYVHEYALTAPFDVSTATHTANVSVSTQDNRPEGVAFSSDGSKMFIAGEQNDRVYEYALGTPFDVTSYSFTASFDVSGQVLALTGVAFSNDGARMFVVGSNRASVYEYALTAPFDVSTASPVDSFGVSGQDSTPTGMAFSSDGAKMFIAGNQHNYVYEYALSSVYPIAMAFVTTWETTGASQTITIPVDGATGNYTVHWGDGSITTHVTNATHAYAEAGNHTVSISGDFTKIRLGGDITNAAKLKSIDQWGSIAWTTMREAFRGASSMVYNATDAPDLSGVTSMQNMFRHAEKFDGNLSGWDVSGVADMDGTFRGAWAFDGDLSAWDTSGSTDMQKMFQEATSFNGDLSAWDVSGVKNMESMFANARDFNGDISGWNTSSVETMQRMFPRTAAFNADISGWDVSGVTDMQGMFAHAGSFHQTLSDWDVSNVTDMEDMFLHTQSFNGDISTWNVSSATTMGDMFNGAVAFNGDISGWNVSAVTNMGGMFDGANSFDQNLGNWHIVLDGDTISGATETLGIGAQNSWLSSRAGYGLGTGGNSDLFVVNATDKTLGLDPSDTHSNGTYLVNITSTGGLGDNNHRAYNVTVTGIDTTTPPPDDAFVTTWEVETSPYVIHMPVEIRSGATATIDWGDGSTTDVGANGRQDHTYAAAGNYTVAVTGGLGRINLNESPSADKLASLDQWGDMEWTTMNNAFRNAENMAYNATDAPDLSGVTSTSLMFANALSFDGDLSGWNVSGVTDMKEMFTRASSFDGDISTWNVSGVTGMSSMFASASSFDGDISSWNTSGVTDMELMFGDASSFNGDISGWNVSSVKNMENMFNGAVKFNQDLSGWDVSSVEKMSLMFHGTTDFNQNLSSWNVSSVTAMFGMFQDAAAFNGDLSGWNPASLITATWMFKNAPAFDGDLSGWDVSRVDNMAGMFHGATDFDGDISTWNVSSVADMTDMFHGATAFNGNVSAWDVSKVSLMENMFRGATDFDGDLSGWNVLGAFFMNNMFRGATAFNSDISGWDVSNVLNMNDMFEGATSFQQNLGKWYIVLDDPSISADDAPGVVDSILTQSRYLDGHSPAYAIGAGGDSGSFNITGGSDLNMNITSPTKSPYTVNITASGDGVFGTGNHRVYNVTVTGLDTDAPTITINGSQSAQLHCRHRLLRPGSRVCRRGRPGPDAVVRRLGRQHPGCRHVPGDVHLHGLVCQCRHRDPDRPRHAGAGRLVCHHVADRFGKRYDNHPGRGRDWQLHRALGRRQHRHAHKRRRARVRRRRHLHRRHHGRA